MAKLERSFCTAKAHTTGGRENGVSRTSNGRLDIKLSAPGTPGTGTNPEELFAVGWSACFLSAIKIVAAKKKIALPAEVAIDAEVDLGTTRGVFGLASRLTVALPGMEREAAQTLADAAYHSCPYSLAAEGNIEVAINVLKEVVTSQPIQWTEEVKVSEAIIRDRHPVIINGLAPGRH